MEKRLDSFHGYTTSVEFDAGSGEFVSRGVANDFAPQTDSRPKICALKATSKRERVTHQIDHHDPETESPLDHPVLV